MLDIICLVTEDRLMEAKEYFVVAIICISVITKGYRQSFFRKMRTSCVKKGLVAAFIWTEAYVLLLRYRATDPARINRNDPLMRFIHLIPLAFQRLTDFLPSAA